MINLQQNIYNSNIKGLFGYNLFLPKLKIENTVVK